MNRKSIRACSALAALMALPNAASAADAPRISTERWVVNFAEQQCVASRNYGDAAKPFILAFKPSPMGEVMQIAIVEQRITTRPSQVPVSVQMDDRPPLSLSMLQFGSLGGRTTYRINVPTEAFAPARTAKILRVAVNRSGPGSFALMQMPAMMSAMDSCLADLRRHWNITPEAQAKLRSRATGSIAGLFSTDDYPDISVQFEEGGTVATALLIDENGKVADCTVTQTSGLAALDAQTCFVVTSRGKFVPAIGADGKPARDSSTSRTRWVMP